MDYLGLAEKALGEKDSSRHTENLVLPISILKSKIGSLAETGFSILQAIRLDDRRDFVIMIDPDVDQKLKDENPALAKESKRERALVLVHLKKLNLRNVFLVSDFETMLDISVDLYEVSKKRMRWEKFSLGGKS